MTVIGICTHYGGRVQRFLLLRVFPSTFSRHSGATAISTTTHTGQGQCSIYPHNPLALRSHSDSGFACSLTIWRLLGASCIESGSGELSEVAPSAESPAHESDHAADSEEDSTRPEPRQERRCVRIPTIVMTAPHVVSARPKEDVTEYGLRSGNKAAAGEIGHLIGR